MLLFHVIAIYVLHIRMMLQPLRDKNILAKTQIAMHNLAFVKKHIFQYSCSLLLLLLPILLHFFYCAEIKIIVKHRCDHSGCVDWYKTHRSYNYK